MQWLVGGAVLSSAAIGIAGFAFLSGSATVTLLAFALLAVAAAQVASFIHSYLHTNDTDKLKAEFNGRMSHVAHESNRVASESMGMVQNIDALRHQTNTLASTLTENLAALRLGNETVAASLKSILEGQRGGAKPAPVPRQRREIDLAIAREQEWLSHLQADVVEETYGEPAQQAFDEPIPEIVEQTDFSTSELADALQLSLEPVVDLYTSNTAHYRMILGMTNAAGHDVPQDVFLHHAERAGERAKLDLFVVQQTLGLLEQLHMRDPAISVFVPVGASTLASPRAIGDILIELGNNQQHAKGVVIDIPHAVLASLPDASLEGLASLARSGVVMSLSQASVGGIELSSLNRLNVRFVSLAAGTVGIGVQVAAGIAGFVQSARALRINVVISNLMDARNVQGLSRIVRYASGPAFALPRKLKRTLPEAVEQSQAA
jgi:EAL domain-containing protein (putative c-di-GMP-specific phosphodiesterase class I)